MDSDNTQVPIIDVSSLVTCAPNRQQAAEQIGRACRECGFFYVVGHAVDESLCVRLEKLAREFFAGSQAEKMRIDMSQGGRAWRGYFPVGKELTSGRPDQKEGIYFGSELPNDHPSVIAGKPLHGPNLFPEIPGFRETTLAYVEALIQLGQQLMAGIAMSLGLDEHYFRDHYTGDPLVLFRIFNYPQQAEASAKCEESWGVGEHTDYGLLTILRQDDVGGLQIKSQSRWIDAPPIPGSFICNIGDMLDRLTRGIYRSTPHRVLNTSRRDRISLPFFFDPNFDAAISPIRQLLDFHPLVDDAAERWDKSSVHELSGTYGDYLLKKVAKVFPELRNQVL